MLAASIVGIVAQQITVIQSAPASATFLATVVPASAHFVSAMITLSGKALRKHLIALSPSFKSKIVPASIMSTSLPTARASFNASSIRLWSKATCKLGIAIISFSFSVLP